MSALFVALLLIHKIQGGAFGLLVSLDLKKVLMMIRVAEL